MTHLADLTSAQAARTADCGGVLVIPVGSIEQHGPHLPLGTDLFIARDLVGRLAAEHTGAVAAPEIALGSSGEHQSFPGTISVGRNVVHDLVLELGRSAALTFTRIVLVSTHGGNAEPVTVAVRRLRYEGREVRAWAPDWAALTGRLAICRTPDAHAGWLETSLMLAIAPQLVRMPLAVAGALQPVSALIGAMQVGGVAAVSSSGVLGDPSGADALIGEQLLGAAAESARPTMTEWT